MSVHKPKSLNQTLSRWISVSFHTGEKNFEKYHVKRYMNYRVTFITPYFQQTPYYMPHISKYMVLNYTTLLTKNTTCNLESSCHWLPSMKINGLKIPEKSMYSSSNTSPTHICKEVDIWYIRCSIARHNPFLITK